MINQKNGKPKPGFGFVIGILTLIMLLGLASELHPARAMELASGLIPDAIDDKYFFPSTGNLTVAAPGVLSNDTDPENDTLTAVPKNNADTALGGKFTLYADGSFIYTKPYTTFVGEDFFFYRIYDGTGYSTLARVTVQPAAA